MPLGGAVQNRPTVEQEMATFKGFSSQDGSTITPETPEDLNPVTGKSVTDKEKAVLAANDKTKTSETPATKTEPVKLTDAESEVVIADLDKQLGREANETEITEALKSAEAKKNGAPTEQKESKRSIAKRIGKALKRAEKAEERAAAAEARIRELEARPLTATAKPANDSKDEAPDPKDTAKFPYGELDTGYIRALARWEAKQEFAEQNKTKNDATQTAEQQKARERAVAARDAFEEAGSDLYDDFEEVVIQGAKAKAWPLSDALGVALLDSDFGPQVAYMLASDVKLAKKVSEMSPSRQITWLGKEEAKLEVAGSGAKTGNENTEGTKAAAKGATGSSQVKETKAPTPITRLRGQGSNSSVPGDTNDFAAFEAAAMGRTNRR